MKRKYQYFLTYNKICIYLTIISIIIIQSLNIEGKYDDLLLFVSGVFIYFIQNRIIEIRSIVGIVNSTLCNSINIMSCECCGNGYKVFGKTSDYTTMISNINSSITEINKISIIDNDFSHLLHLIYCYYDDLRNQVPGSNNPEIDISLFNYYKIDKHSKSNAMIKFDIKLIKSIIEIF